MKKLLLCILLLNALMLFSSVASAEPVTILDSGNCGSQATYTLYSDGQLTIEGTGTITSHPWTGRLAGKVKNVLIESGITSTGYYSFAYCENLVSVEMPDTVTSIGSEAFLYCTSLTDVTIPGSVNSIGTEAFFCCTALTEIAIPDGVESLGNYCFGTCTSLAGIEIPDSVTTIEPGVFAECTRLMDINVDEENQIYSSLGGVLYNKAKTKLHTYPAGRSELAGIPDSVTIIGEDACSGCRNLTSITVPNGITTIEEWAFSECRNLVHVTLPDGLKTIADKAFQYCVSIEDINIPDSVRTIGDYAFYKNRSLKRIDLPNEVSIGDVAFMECDELTTVVIPAGVRHIGDMAFKDCFNLDKVVFLVKGSDVTIDYGDVFAGNDPTIYCYRNSPAARWAENQSYDQEYVCYLDHVLRLPERTECIEDEAFAGLNNVDLVYVPVTVRNIGENVFADSNITIVTPAGSYAETWAGENGVPVLAPFEQN